MDNMGVLVCYSKGTGVEKFLPFMFKLILQIDSYFKYYFDQGRKQVANFGGGVEG